MSDFKETCIWMSYRYVIGRKAIASVMHAEDIAKHMEWVPIDRWAFTGMDILREVKRKKKKCKCLEIKHLHFVWYPVDYLFSNQFMEDLGRIYSLRKYYPSFDDL